MSRVELGNPLNFVVTTPFEPKVGSSIAPVEGVGIDNADDKFLRSGHTLHRISELDVVDMIQARIVRRVVAGCGHEGEFPSWLIDGEQKLICPAGKYVFYRRSWQVGIGYGDGGDIDCVLRHADVGHRPAAVGRDNRREFVDRCYRHGNILCRGQASVRGLSRHVVDRARGNGFKIGRGEEGQDTCAGCRWKTCPHPVLKSNR